MMPPGLSFTAVSEKALAASKSATLARSYFSWDDMLAFNDDGWFPTRPRPACSTGWTKRSA